MAAASVTVEERLLLCGIVGHGLYVELQAACDYSWFGEVGALLQRVSVLAAAFEVASTGVVRVVSCGTSLISDSQVGFHVDCGSYCLL